MDLNASGGMREGASEGKVRDLARFRESSHFGPRERAALEYAEAAIVELTAIVALENFRSKFNSVLQVPAQGFCPIPVTPAG